MLVISITNRVASNFLIKIASNYSQTLYLNIDISNYMEVSSLCVEFNVHYREWFNFDFLIFSPIANNRRLLVIGSLIHFPYYNDAIVIINIKKYI